MEDAICYERSSNRGLANVEWSDCSTPQFNGKSFLSYMDLFIINIRMFLKVSYVIIGGSFWPR